MQRRVIRKRIFNYYNILFSNDTCIIICNGDKNKEGTIEKVSSNITEFFGYKEEEVKGINIGALMPKMFERDHTGFMKKHIEILLELVWLILNFL